VNGKLSFFGLVGAQVYLCVRFVQNAQDPTAATRAQVNGAMCAVLFAVIFLAFRELRAVAPAHVTYYPEVVEEAAPDRRTSRALRRRVDELHRHSIADARLLAADDEAQRATRSAWVAWRDRERARWTMALHIELRPWLQCLTGAQRGELVAVLGRYYDAARLVTV
jgi:hypothetical protein